MEFPDLDPGEILPANGSLDGHPETDVFMLPDDPSGFVVKRDYGKVFVSVGKYRDGGKQEQAHQEGSFD